MKFDMQLMLDKFFKQTIYLRPLPDKTFEAINITGETGTYLKDKPGATILDPSCIVPVRGLKRVRNICIKMYNSSMLTDMFNGHVIECPHCQKTLTVPNGQLTEKMLADMLDYAEIAGRLQADDKPEEAKKMNYILFIAAGALIIGIAIYFRLGAIKP